MTRLSCKVATRALSLRFCRENFNSGDLFLAIFSPVASQVRGWLHVRFSSRAGDATKFEKNRITCASKKSLMWPRLKDGAYYCYCTYVLRIWRYSGFLILDPSAYASNNLNDCRSCAEELWSREWGFLWVVPTNTRIFLRALKLC